jgi:hypothetical protein
MSTETGEVQNLADHVAPDDDGRRYQTDLNHRVDPVTRRNSLVLGVAAILVGRSANAEETLAGTVETLRGQAFAESAKLRRQLQLTTQIFVNDLIETAGNSALTMQLGKTTIVKLGALTKLRIDNFVVTAGGTLDLEQ